MSNLSVIKMQVKQYVETADENTLKIVHKILESAEGIDDPLMNMTAEQEASFQRGISDADNGRLTPHEEVMKQFKK